MKSMMKFNRFNNNLTEHILKRVKDIELRIIASGDRVEELIIGVYREKRLIYEYIPYNLYKEALKSQVAIVYVAESIINNIETAKLWS